MVMERGYTSQVGPAQAPGPVLATPETYGAGVAQQVGQMGDTVHAVQLRAYELDRQQQAQSQSADFFHKFAQVRQNQDQQQIELRSNPVGPGGVGHVDATRKLLDADAQSLFGGITEERVLREAREQWDAYSTGQIKAAADWAEGQRIGKSIVDTGQSISLSANRVNTSADPGVWAQELQSSHGMVNAMQVPDDVKAKLARQVDTELASARIDYLNRNDPKASVALIDAGVYNAFLDPHELQSLRRAGDVEIRRQAAEGRQQIAFQKADLNQQYELMKGQAAAGQDIDTRAVGALRMKALALGDNVKAQELQFLAGNQVYVRQYRVLAQNPAELQRHVTELAAKAHPSAEEQRELGWAREHAPGLVSRFAGDPVGYMQMFGPAGTQPPAIDLSKPDTLLARAQWRNNQARTSGQPDLPMLSDTEVSQVRQAMRKGDAGRISVLSILGSLKEDDRAMVARQIAPDDKLFQHQAQLDPDLREMIQHGHEVQQGNAGFWPLSSFKDEQQRKSAAQLKNFDAMLGFAMKGMAPVDLNAAKQTMRDYIAGKFASQGKANAHAITADDLRVATAYALGGQIKDGRQYGGVAIWSGPQSFVVIPEKMTPGQFWNAIANDRAAQDRRGTGPVNLDGKPFDLKLAQPVMIGDGQYRWETSGGVVMGKNKQPYITRIGGR